LHRPLHVAGYYLNPILHYHPDFKADYEVKRGMYECLERMGGDIDEITKIDAQIEGFKSKSGFLGSEIAQLHSKQKLQHSGGNNMVMHFRNYKDLQLEFWV